MNNWATKLRNRNFASKIALLPASLSLLLGCGEAGFDDGVGEYENVESVSEAIVNGAATTMDDMRRYTNAVTAHGNFAGTGILVGPRLVLTAGHLGFNKDNGSPVRVEYYTDDGIRHIARVQGYREIHHPDYVSFAKGVDLGLWILEHPILFSKPYWKPFSRTDNDLSSEVFEVFGYGGSGNQANRMWDCTVHNGVPFMGNHGGVESWRMKYNCYGPGNTASAEGGDSGGPLFNQNGELLGLHVKRTGSTSPKKHIAMYVGATESDGSRPYIDWVEGWMEDIATKAVIGDFNGDGLGDIAYADPNGLANGWVDVSERNPKQKFPDGSRIDTFLPCEGSLHAGDFNDDGIDDLLCYMENKTPSTPFVGVKHGHAEGNGSPEDTFDGDDSWTSFESLSDKCYSVHVGDFDGAYGDDLFCRRRDGGGRAAYMNLGPHPGTISYFSDEPEYSSSLRWCGQDLFVGDFDGNGKDDLLCYNAGTALYFRFSKGSAGTYAYTARTARNDWCSGTLRVGDMNADGVTDLFCRDDATNEYKVLLSKAVTQSLASFDFTTNDHTGSLGGWCDAAGRTLFMYPFSADASADLICSQEDQGKFWIDYKKAAFFNGLSDYRAPKRGDYL
jgi:V8-like Glu-specific endopeptidase